MIDTKKVTEEVAKGTSFVCAMCHKYWEGKELRRQRKKLLNIIRDDQLCTAKKSCGSPFAGEAFGEYEGPLVNFERWCFVCGDSSKFVVRIRNLVRTVGVCEKHVRWFPSFTPEAKGSQERARDWSCREIIGDAE